MIAEIKGTVVSREKDALVVMTGGLGLEVHVPSRLLQSAGTGDALELHTRLLVRDDGWHLYGFQTREERNVFDLLLTVKGIGPKLAMGVLSAISPEEFYHAVVSQNEKLLTSLPGVGRKTAERIMVELRDRIGLSQRKDTEKSVTGEDVFGEAIEALLALGYGWQEAKDALDRVLWERSGSLARVDLETLLKEALRKLARI